MEAYALTFTEEVLTELIHTALVFTAPMLDPEHDGTRDMHLALYKGVKHHMYERFEAITALIDAKIERTSKTSDQKVQSDLKHYKEPTERLDHQLRLLAALIDYGNDFAIFSTGNVDFDVTSTFIPKPFFKFERVGPLRADPGIQDLIKRGLPITYTHDFRHYQCKNMDAWPTTDRTVAVIQAPEILKDVGQLGEVINDMKKNLQTFHTIVIAQRNAIKKYVSESAELQAQLEAVKRLNSDLLVEKIEPESHVAQQREENERKEKLLRDQDHQLHLKERMLDTQIVAYRESPIYLMRKTQEHELGNLVDKAQRYTDLKIYCEKKKQYYAQREAKIIRLEATIKERDLKIEELRNSHVLTQTLLAEVISTAAIYKPSDRHVTTVLKQMQKTDEFPELPTKACQNCSFSNRTADDECAICFAQL